MTEDFSAPAFDTCPCWFKITLFGISPLHSNVSSRSSEFLGVHFCEYFEDNRFNLIEENTDNFCLK